MATKEHQSQLDSAPGRPAASTNPSPDAVSGGQLVPAGPQLGNELIKAELDDEDAGSDAKMANAPFVNKVWRIVNDPANQQYIRWVPGGKSIQVVDREGFEKQLLPYYFKHKRFTSFVRQLNMYGWHKVQDLSAGTMQSSEEHWQFANPNFIQGRPELLRKIVRNKGHRVGASNGGGSGGSSGAAHGIESWQDANHAQPGAQPEADDDDKNQSLKAILHELEQIKSRQIHIGEDLGRMRKDNELLWAEYYQTRERYDKHSQMLSRILRFLATVYGNQSKILDLSDPNTPAGAAAAERILRGPMDSPQQHYVGLLPANPMDRQSPAESFKTSSIHDLREIEQMQNQIEEASTPTSLSNGTSPSTRDSLSSDQSGLGSLAGAPPLTNAYDSGRALNTRGSTALNARGSTAPHTPKPPSGGVGKALVPSRRVSQALLGPPYASAPSPSNRVTQLRESPDAGPPQDPVTTPRNNQLVRAANQRLIPTANPAVPGSAIPGSAISGSPAPNVAQQYQSPQLQEISDTYDDPDKLFPELEDFTQTGQPSLTPLTSQELEQISRDVASNGMSLQNIQDWLNKQNLDDDEQFNVDDFLSTEDDKGRTGTPASPKSVPASGSEGSTKPDRKRVRVG